MTDLTRALINEISRDPTAVKRLREILADPAADAAAVVTVPALLSVAQAGEILGCSPRTVRRRIADGSIPAVLEQERMMVRGDDLRAYIDGLQRLGPAPGHRRTKAPRAARRDYDFLR